MSERRSDDGPLGCAMLLLIMWLTALSFSVGTIAAKLDMLPGIHE
jgi:hypothetical protein